MNLINKLKVKPIILCILDGWGIANKAENNAILQANTPCYLDLLKNYPNSILITSGLDVGLPVGQMGNSEVGHMNIGSGRIILQELPKIDQAIATGEFAENVELNDLIKKLQETKQPCHILGLLSDGGVHSHINHIIEFVRIISANKIKTYLHAFLDGRDTEIGSAEGFINNFEKIFKDNIYVKIATISGRYYAMDRDHKWDRIKLAYSAIVEGKGPKATTALAAYQENVKNNVTDEFIIPTIIGGYNGIKDGDGLVMANFRSDRARLILDSLLNKEFKGFTINKRINFGYSLGLVEYSNNLNLYLKSMFKSSELNNTLPEIISNNGLSQLRIAETEKYAHVTFFFNGGREQPYKGEQRILVPSSTIATYDLKPAMAAFEITKELIAHIARKEYNLIIVNYANADMVGHSGNIAASVKAVEVLDQCLTQITKIVKETDSILIITADHGNAEKMFDIETGKKHTSHTTNPVPFILVGNNLPDKLSLSNGRLCDIAPTILELLNIDKPLEMTGNSLIKLMEN